MWAIIQAGKVYQVIDFSPVAALHQDLQTLPVPIGLTPWVREGYLGTSDGVVPPSLESFQQQLLEALATRRWREEVKGALVGQVRYHTDTASQGKILGAVVLGDKFETLNAPGTYAVTWKTMSGWVELNLAELTNAAVACGMHVQQAYARERQICGLIQAAATWQEALAAYNENIDLGWPT